MIVRKLPLPLALNRLTNLQMPHTITDTTSAKNIKSSNLEQIDLPGC